MKFPLILRTDHEEQARLTNVIICTLQQKVVDLSIALTQKEKEIEVLIQELSLREAAKEVIDKSRKKQIEPISAGRGGWRAKASQRSLSSVPTPKDSSAALEERVKKEGGV